MDNKDSSTEVTSPPAAPIRVELTKVDWFWRRWFSYVGFISILLLWAACVYLRQPQWPCCVAFCFLAFVYLTNATAEEIVRVVSSTGIIKSASDAASSASNAASSVANAVDRVADRILPTTVRAASE